MKTTKIVVVALVLFSSFPILARQTDTHVQQSSSATAAGAQANQSADASANTNRHGAQVQGAGAANAALAAHGALAIAGNSATQTGGNLRGAAFNGNAAAIGLLEAPPTAIPGVMLASDATGSASGTLSALRRNVHLDSGTQMLLGISSTLAR